MHKSLIFFLFGLSVWPAWSCRPTTDSEKLAEVDGAVITRAAFDRSGGTELRNLRQRLYQLERQKLDEYIGATLLTQEAKEREFGVMDDVRDPADHDDNEAPFDDGTTAHEESELSAGPAADGAARATLISPFAGVAELPDDLADAVESLKLAILRHKMAGWQEISAEGVLGALDALKVLVHAPAENDV